MEREAKSQKLPSNNGSEPGYVGLQEEETRNTGMWVGVPGGPCIYSGVTWTPDSTWEAKATPMVPAGQLFVEKWV